MPRKRFGDQVQLKTVIKLLNYTRWRVVNTPKSNKIGANIRALLMEVVIRNSSIADDSE